MNVCFSQSFNDTYLQGDFSDQMLCLPLHLSVGKPQALTISEKVFETDKTIQTNLEETSVSTVALPWEALCAEQSFTIWVSTSCAWDKCNLCFFTSIMHNKNLFLIDTAEIYSNHPEALAFKGKLLEDLDIEEIEPLIGYRRAISASEKTVSISTWMRISTENSGLRIIKNNHITSVTETFFDSVIIKYVSTEKRNAAFTIVCFYAEEGYVEYDYFIYQRLSSMLRQGRIHSEHTLIVSPKTKIWKDEGVIS